MRIVKWLGHALGTVATVAAVGLAGWALVGCSSGEGASDTPRLSSVEAMAGGLHVTWENPSPPCDTIEGERRAGDAPFQIVFVVPGEVDNKHDGTATDDETYVYRVRCTRGDASSAYSNEMSGNPVR